MAKLENKVKQEEKRRPGVIPLFISVLLSTIVGLRTFEYSYGKLENHPGKLLSQEKRKIALSIEELKKEKRKYIDYKLIFDDSFGDTMYPSYSKDIEKVNALEKSINLREKRINEINGSPQIQGYNELMREYYGVYIPLAFATPVITACFLSLAYSHLRNKKRNLKPQQNICEDQNE